MKVCNLDYLSSISPNNPQFIQEMVRIFLKNVPIAMDALNNAEKINDWETLQFHAHKLRSHIDCMGISTMYSDMAKQIEENAKHNENIEKIRELLSELNYMFKDAFEDLRSFEK